MKLKDYMKYLIAMQDRYGDDIDIVVEINTVYSDHKIKTIYRDYESEKGYTDIFRPKYNKEHNCIVLQKIHMNYD